MQGDVLLHLPGFQIDGVCGEISFGGIRVLFQDSRTIITEREVILGGSSPSSPFV